MFLDYKFVVCGDVVWDLFNMFEVLVFVSELVNGISIVIDFVMCEVIYMYLMFECYEIIFVNGVEIESFYLVDVNMSVLDEMDCRCFEVLDLVFVD